MFVVLQGLFNALKMLAPNAEHRNCARHIYANQKKKFGSPKYKKLFWDAAKSTCESQFHSTLKDLKNEYVEAYDHFLEKNPHVFCRSLIGMWVKSETQQITIFVRHVMDTL